MAHRQFSPDEVAEALTTGHGVVSVAAKILGCSTQTIYDHIKKHPQVAQAQERGDDAIDDLAEIKLIQKIKKGNMKAITFRLETKAKKRGYTKRIEHAGPEGGPIPGEFTLKFTA